MVSKQTARGKWCTLLIAAVIAATFNGAWASDEPLATSAVAYKSAETELQSRVMSFADRFVATLLTSFESYDNKRPSENNRNRVLSIVVYSLWNAYIIASESDPDVALLDMVSMVTLGRMVFEEQGIKSYGKAVKPIVQGFRDAEADIRGIAALSLDPGQIERLMAIIRRWRKAHPKVTHFPFIRFSNFSADRRESKLERDAAPDGLIDSVEAAAQQAEEMRMVVERGMYLGTRMPQLAGLFAELWAAKLADDVATERRAAITQLKETIQVARQATVEDFMARQKLIVEDTLQQLTRTAEALVERTMRQIAILLALFLVGLTLANLLVGYVFRQKHRDRQQVS